MKPDELILFPFNGNAREAAFTVDVINQRAKQWEIRGFIDDNAAITGRKFHSWGVLGGREVLRDPSFKGRLCAVPGHPNSFAQREQIIRSLEWPDDRWATLIDPTAIIAPDARIGKNTVIMANVYIGPTARIGDHCIILPHSVIHHDAVLEDYTVVGSHVTVSGWCQIGRQCYVGSGSLLRQEIRVGQCSLLGMGSVVVKDIPSGVVVVGNPARILRKAE